MSSFTHLLGPAGGIRYHLAALRYKRALWIPFLEKVDEWLNSTWQTREPNLIIFGPSAGWTLNAKFLGRFKNVTCVEPDAVARALFRRRFAKVTKLSMIPDTDILPWWTPKGTLAPLQKFLADQDARHGTSAVLFSNFLGQVPVLAPKLEFAQIGRALLNELSCRSWASYHDLLSSTETANSRAAHSWATLPAPLATSVDQGKLEAASDLAARFFPWPGQRVDVIDHDTRWLSCEHDTHLAIWHIRPRSRHLIAFVCESSADSKLK